MTDPEVCQACGHAATQEDTLITVDAGTRIHLRHTLDPRSGFYVAPAGPDPKTGDGFEAPRPEEVYAHAPDMLRESADLMRVATARQVEAAAQAAKGESLDRHLYGDPAKFEDEEHHQEHERLYLLRRAALADRLAIEWPAEEPFLRDAVQTSQALIAFDRKHPHLAPGPIGPNSPEWDPSARPYVRQCLRGMGLGLNPPH